jgi:cell division protein ZapA (FtsZ GTPase activity inhibitor)
MDGMEVGDKVKVAGAFEAALRSGVAAAEQTLDAWRAMLGVVCGTDETTPAARLRRIAVQLSDMVDELRLNSGSYRTKRATRFGRVEYRDEDEVALECAAGNVDVALDEIDAAIRWLEWDSRPADKK